MRPNLVAKFAFIIHPLDVSDVARKYKFARYMSPGMVESILRFVKPSMVSEITGVESLTGATTSGWFVGCPMTPRQLMSGGKIAVEKVIRAGKIAQDLGADIVGLGAYTSIVGDGGREVADALDIAVTTGNSYTCYTAVEGALKAAEMMGIVPKKATAAVLGATGSIGRACALILADKVAHIALVGRRLDRLEEVGDEVRGRGATVASHTGMTAAMRDADIVITVTSALEAVVEPEQIKSGAVVCDVARPRDVSVAVAQKRDDVLVIEGGVVAVPGPVNFHFNFGFPPRTSYACMAETMMLALEGRIEDYSIGRDLDAEKVAETGRWAAKHGFKLAGFRAFEHAVSEEEIARRRERAEAIKAGRG